jgi:hypothetical protein
MYPDTSGIYPDVSGIHPDKSRYIRDVSGYIRIYPVTSGMYPDISGIYPDTSGIYLYPDTFRFIWIYPGFQGWGVGGRYGVTTISPSEGQPSASLSAARGLATLRA